MKLNALLETFDTKDPRSWIRKDGPGSVVGQFKVGGVTYDVDFTKASSDLDFNRNWIKSNFKVDLPKGANIWQIVFSVGGDEDVYDTVGITGTGNAFKVFSNVLRMVKIFMNKNRVDAIYFTGVEDSRKNLYAALCKKIAKLYGFTVMSDAVLFDKGDEFVAINNKYVNGQVEGQVERYKRRNHLPNLSHFEKLKALKSDIDAFKDRINPTEPDENTKKQKIWSVIDQDGNRIPTRKMTWFMANDMSAEYPYSKIVATQ